MSKYIKKLRELGRQERLAIARYLSQGKLRVMSERTGVPISAVNDLRNQRRSAINQETYDKIALAIHQDYLAPKNSEISLEAKVEAMMGVANEAKEA